MKYKLININTEEEHLCDKVTINDFEYYINEDITSEEVGDIVYSKEFNEVFQILDSEALVGTNYKVIATNDPNVNVPKVVDEVAKKTAEFAFCYPGVQTEEEYDSKLLWFYCGLIDSQETPPFSEEDMIDFSNWLVNQKWDKIMIQGYNDDGSLKCKTTKELLQFWKEQKPEIIYYNNV